MLIKNGLVMRPDGTAAPLDIRVEDGRIAELGQFDGMPPAASGEPVLDARDRLIAPGLINTHNHSNENYFKGLFDNLPLELWLLFSYPVMGAPPQNPRQVYIRTMLGCMEMLKRGCTAVVDFLYEMPETTVESVAAVLQAYIDSGMRVLLCIGYADKVYYETTPLAMDLLTPELKAQIDATPLLSPEENIAFVDIVRQIWDGRENRVAIGLGPSGPQRCSDRQLELSAAYATQHDLRIHIHTLETKMQAFSGQLYYGKTIIEHLADLKFLSPRVHLNHAIWLTERDIDLVAASGAGTTHNLLSNFKLGSGISPVPEMLAKGINVSLGTDGKSSNDSQDMYEVLKAVALLHKTQLPEFQEWLGAPEAWRMATSNGAAALGLAGESGEIAVGRRADLVLFDLNTIPFTPLNNPLHQLVYCLPSHVVDTVLVEGQVVVSQGRLTRIDETAILAEGQELGQEFVAANQPTWEIARALFPSVAAGYRHAVTQDVGVNRYLRPQGGGHD